MSFIIQLNQLCVNTLVDHLGIEFTESGEGYLVATMPVNERTRQPMGILHGGASLALAETVGSAGSIGMVDLSRYNVVGMQVTANHVGMATQGIVTATATLIHKGSRSHIWDVVIKDETGRNISLCRVTNMLIEKD